MAHPFFAQTIDQHLRIVCTRHALGLTLDTLDDEQKLRFVLGQPLLQDFNFLNLLLEATAVSYTHLTLPTSDLV